MVWGLGDRLTSQGTLGCTGPIEENVRRTTYLHFPTTRNTFLCPLESLVAVPGRRAVCDRRWPNSPTRAGAARPPARRPCEIRRTPWVRTHFHLRLVEAGREGRLPPKRHTRRPKEAEVGLTTEIKTPNTRTLSLK